MPGHRSRSADFKRQLVAEYHAGGTLHALGRRHHLPRNLIRIWIEKAEAGSLDHDMASAELLGEYETRIAAFERLVGRQALGIEFPKRAQKARAWTFRPMIDAGFGLGEHLLPQAAARRPLRG